MVPFPRCSDGDKQLCVSIKQEERGRGLTTRANKGLFLFSKALCKRIAALEEEEEEEEEARWGNFCNIRQRRGGKCTQNEKRF